MGTPERLGPNGPEPATNPPNNSQDPEHWPGDLDAVRLNLSARDAPDQFYLPKFWTRVLNYAKTIPDNGPSLFDEFDKFLLWAVAKPDRECTPDRFFNWLKYESKYRRAQG